MVGNTFRRRKLLANLSLILLCAVSGGCVLKGKSPAPLASASTKDNAYTLNILEEVNAGSRLFVTAELATDGSIDTSNAVLRLRAMKNGDKVGEAFSPLSPLTVSKSDPTKHLVKISVDAKDFTDYQIDLFWGNDARNYLASLPKSSVISVSGVTLLSNAKSKKGAISGQLENRGIEPLTNCTLLVQFVWIPEGQVLDESKLDASKESEVEVTGITILSGESKPFFIELETEIPTVAGGTYQPVVRIKD